MMCEDKNSIKECVRVEQSQEIKYVKIFKKEALHLEFHKYTWYNIHRGGVSFHDCVISKLLMFGLLRFTECTVHGIHVQ